MKIQILKPLWNEKKREKLLKYQKPEKITIYSISLISFKLL